MIGSVSASMVAHWLKTNGFMTVAGDIFVQDFCQFTQFGAGFFTFQEWDFLIMQRQGIADQAHFDQTHQQNITFFGSKWAAAGNRKQLGKMLFEFVIGLPLRIGHFNEVVCYRCAAADP